MLGGRVKVAIPGIAFGALKDSGFAKQYPGLWQRIMDYSTEFTVGRGVSVRIDLSEDDWEALRACILLLVRRLHAATYHSRGMQGNIVMQQLQISMGRIDEALHERVD